MNIEKIAKELGIKQEILEFAVKAHEGQTRKYTGEPYIEHCIDVARRVNFNAILVCDPRIVTPALLHDILEDTQVTYEELRDFLIKEYEFHFYSHACGILSTVVDLTDFYTKESFPNLSRIERKHREYYRLRDTISNDAKFIKKHDLMSNLKDYAIMKQHDPEFAKIYREECIHVCEAIGASVQEIIPDE